METLLITFAPQLISMAGLVLAGLASWGIAILKQKVNVEAGKSALDQIDNIVGTVVADLSQTTARDMKAAAKDGHLSKAEKDDLKRMALRETKILVSREVEKAAGKAVHSIDAYVTRKIEERVLASKADQPGQALPIIN